MRRRLGFTLLEVMVAALVGGISILVAAKVAQVVIQQSAKSRERTDFHERARAVTRQLRADLRTAGYGSTGSIAYDNSLPGILGAGNIGYITPNGYLAMAAVNGVSNTGPIGVGGLTSQAGADMLMLVVPDPSTAVRTTDHARAPGSITTTETGPIGPCGAPGSLIYILDHSTPTGVGRAQLSYVVNWAGVGLTVLGSFQFTAAPGSRVMCARISTYWLENDGSLHRTDITNQGTGVTNVGGSAVYVGNNASFNDSASPGIIDFQVAYGMSAEWRLRTGGGGPGVLDPLGRYALDDGASAMTAPIDWADVRTVRFNILSRTLRKVGNEGTGTAPTFTAREDGAIPAPPLTRAHQVEWITSSEVLMSLRLFDEITVSGTDPDPY